jgi:hypothetical protein
MNANTVPTISTLINNTLPLEGVAVSNTRNYGWLNQQIQTLLAGNSASGIPTVSDVQASSCLRGRSESETLLLVLQGLLQLVGASDGSGVVRTTQIICNGSPITLGLDGVKGQLAVDTSVGNGRLYVNNNGVTGWTLIGSY